MRLRQLQREMWRLSGAETVEQLRTFLKYHPEFSPRCEIIRAELVALVRGDIVRAHGIRDRRARSARALDDFWVTHVLAKR